MSHHRRPLSIALTLAAVVALLSGCAMRAARDAELIRSSTGLWGLDAINVLPAWKRVPDATAAVIAFADSGQAAAHPDLPAPQLLAGHNQCLAPGTPDEDQDGHGTNVAGVMAAKATATRTRGVARGAQLRPYKFLCPSGFFQDLAFAALRAAAGGNPDVLNASWAVLPDDGAIVSQIEAVIDASPGVLFVFAAPPGTGPYPAFASRPNVLVVTAVDRKDTLPRWAGHDPKGVHLAAPGVGIATTDIPDTWTTFQGSSAAAAFVSGCGALVKLAGAHLKLSGAQIRDYLVKNADVVPTLTSSVFEGRRLNCGNAVNAVPER